MSVELTGMAIDILPAKLPLKQDKESQVEATDKKSVVNVEILTEIRRPDDEELVTLTGMEKSQDEKGEMTTPQLEKVAKQLQEFMGKMNRGLEFLVDEDSGRDVIKVIDKSSGELIKQYPSEEVLSLVSKLSEATGNFVDSKI